VIEVSRRRLRCALVLQISVLMLTLFQPSFVRPVYAWWDLGHTIITSNAIRLMPDRWRSFLSYYEAILNETSIYPDRIYKHLDAQEDYRHFIDLEIWDPGRPETGTLPHETGKFAEDAVQALRASDWNKALYLFGRVSHYLADLHQPYHATKDYNPRAKGGTPLHPVLDESLQVHFSEFRVVERGDLANIEPIHNITLFCFQVARQSYSFLERINRTLIDEEKTWSNELTRIVENRTNCAIVAVARVWYSIILRSEMSAPGIDEPNDLSIKLAETPQELSPDKEATIQLVVADRLGIRTPATVQAAINNQPLPTYGFPYVPEPLGRYGMTLPKEMLAELKGRYVNLAITAEKPGFQPTRINLSIKVKGISLQMVQALIAILVATAGTGVTAVVYLRRRRVR